MKRESSFGNTKSIKIAMLGQKRVPSREGGIEVVVGELSVRMAKLGNSVTCINRMGHHVSGKKYDCEKMTDYNGVRLVSAFTINRKGLAALTASFFGSLIAAFGTYNVVHFHAEGPAFMCWLPKLFRKKIVVTIHGLDYQRAKWGRLASDYIMLGEKNAVRYADQIIVLSRQVQEYFKQKYNRETVYIPNGVNRHEKAPADIITSKYGLHKDEYILFLGRLVPEKGIKNLIIAFKNIQTDKKLVIAGGSSDTANFAKELKEIAKDDSRIIFTGFVQNKELEELYSNAYIYTLPSDLEGMPLTLLEAMSYGNCCLISNIPECTEVAGNYAYTFKKGDINDLQMKLQDLCNSKEKVFSMKNQTSDFVCIKYNWDNVVDQTLFLYHSIIEKKADVAIALDSSLAARNGVKSA